METTLRLFAAITSVLFPLTVIALIIFWKTYLKKKTENIVMKEDIAELTELAESVKRELDISTERRISWQSLQRDTVIRWFEKYNEWLNTIYSIYIGNPHLIETLVSLQKTYDSSEGSFRLFIEDETILLALIPLVEKTIKLQNEVVVFHTAFLNINLEIDKIDIIHKVTDIRITQYQVLMTSYNKLLPRLRTIIRDSI